MGCLASKDVEKEPPCETASPDSHNNGIKNYSDHNLYQQKISILNKNIEDREEIIRTLFATIKGLELKVKEKESEVFSIEKISIIEKASLEDKLKYVEKENENFRKKVLEYKQKINKFEALQITEDNFFMLQDSLSDLKKKHEVLSAEFYKKDEELRSTSEAYQSYYSQSVNFQNEAYATILDLNKKIEELESENNILKNNEKNPNEVLE